MTPHRDPRDKRLFVPKPGGGLTLNFAHPAAWWVLVTTTIVPLAVVAIVLVAVLL